MTAIKEKKLHFNKLSFIYAISVCKYILYYDIILHQVTNLVLNETSNVYKMYIYAFKVHNTDPSMAPC